MKAVWIMLLFYLVAVVSPAGLIIATAIFLPTLTTTAAQSVVQEPGSCQGLLAQAVKSLDQVQTNIQLYGHPSLIDSRFFSAAEIGKIKRDVQKAMEVCK